MKTYQTLASLAVVACAAALIPLSVRAEPAAGEPAAEAESAPAPASNKRHLELCEMLGLQVGRTYEFMLTGNNELHYWQVRSLGAKGWILAKDSRYPATWVNLSQVIAVTPLDVRAAQPQERPKKPNRTR